MPPPKPKTITSRKRQRKAAALEALLEAGDEMKIVIGYTIDGELVSSGTLKSTVDGWDAAVRELREASK